MLRRHDSHVWEIIQICCRGYIYRNVAEAIHPPPSQPKQVLSCFYLRCGNFISDYPLEGEHWCNCKLIFYRGVRGSNSSNFAIELLKFWFSLILFKLSDFENRFESGTDSIGTPVCVCI